MLAPQKESIFGCSCRLWLLSWRRARVLARSCSLLSKYLPISWKQRKEQSHAQCHVRDRIRIFDNISEHVKVAKSVDIAVPELAFTYLGLSSPSEIRGIADVDSCLSGTSGCVQIEINPFRSEVPWPSKLHIRLFWFLSPNIPPPLYHSLHYAPLEKKNVCG